LNGEQQYLVDLIHAWAAGRTSPVTLPPHVKAEAIWARLCKHNVEAPLAPLLPAGEQMPNVAQEIDHSRARSRFLLLECERLLPVLAGEDWRPVLLKGGALALGTYARQTDRWFLDLDVLVPRAEVDRVCARLETAGYRHLRGKRDPLFYEKYHLHNIMLGPQGSVLEIHWDLTLPGSVYRHDVAGVFDRAETCTLGRYDVLCAAPVDQVLHGVYQNIADGFVDLRRVLDLVLLARRLEPADWRYLVEESQRTGMAKALYLSLHNMKCIAGQDVPAGVMADLDPGRTLNRTLRGLHVAANCLDRRANHSGDYVPTLHFLLTPGKTKQVREILRSLWVGEAMLLDLGHRPGRMPGLIRRSWIGLRQLKTLLVVLLRTSRAVVTG